MRVGQNPAKSIERVPQPQRVTVALLSYIPFLGGYYAQSLQVLETCLGSLWESTHTPFDLLVFDNASCVEVRAYLQEAHSQGRIQYLVLSDQNIGKGGAWNFIFQAAPGEIIAYADSDVLFRPGWLERSLEILAAFPQAGMVTARPMRTPEAFYTSTLEWAHQQADVQLEQGNFLPWEIYLEHVLSLGTSEEQAREWFASRQDIRLTRQGVSAHVSAAHFQFTAPKSILAQFVPFEMDRPMGQVRSLDEQMNASGYLRLTTCEPLVKHLGNRLEAGSIQPPLPRPLASPSGRAGSRPMGSVGSVLAGDGVRPARKRGFFYLPPIKKALLRIYDEIFRLYHT